MTPTGTVHKSFICTGLKRSFHSHPVKPSTQIQLSNTIHLNSLKTDVYTELLRHATHQTHLLASISHLCLMGRCPFSLLSTFFEVKKHEWHSSYLSNQLQKKLDKLLLNWDVCIILANYLFILGYSHCSLNCCPKSYQVTWPQETDSEGNNWFTYKPAQSAIFKKWRNIFTKWVQNLRSSASVQQTSLSDESVQWKMLSEGHGLQKKC